MEKQIFIKADDPQLMEQLKAAHEKLKADKDHKVIVIRDFTISKENIKSIDLKKRTITAVVSTATKDRHGDTINPEGWDLKNYKNNPVLLWAHNYSQPPIGKASSVSVDMDGKMIATFKFADTEFATEILKLYEGGFLNSFSVGFRVLAFGTRVTEGDPSGYTFDEQELLEVSAVPVPANPEANAIRSLVSAETAKQVIKTEDEEESDDEQTPDDPEPTGDSDEPETTETPETDESGEAASETTGDGESNDEPSDEKSTEAKLDKLIKLVQDNTDQLAKLSSRVETVEKSQKVGESTNDADRVIRVMREIKADIQDADKSIGKGLRKLKIIK